MRRGVLWFWEKSLNWIGNKFENEIFNNFDEDSWEFLEMEPKILILKSFESCAVWVI